MAPKSGSVLNEPRSAVEIAESIKSCRELIRVADAQIDKAKSDLSIARLGLAEVELELTTRGLRPSEHGFNGERGVQ
ncbi:MAG TPA: hypothetical protein VJN18_20955 [Polyangiaceae bacterium]|nr:hypothetical protein [Polyangiaceae bacterium]